MSETVDTKRVIFDDVERLRGFCCILVMFQHIIHTPCYMRFIFNILSQWLICANGVVHVFFAISGFVVTLSLKEKINELSGKLFIDRLAEAKDLLYGFYKRRFFRIYPVIFFVFIASCIFYICTGEDSSWLQGCLRAPAELLSGTYNNAVTTYIFKEKIHYGGFGSLWTVAVESQFYLLWPLALILCKDNNVRAIVALVLGCAMLFLVQPLMTYYHGFSYYSTLNNVSELFLGSFFACIYTKNFRANFNRQGAMLISAILAMTIWLYPNLCEDREFFGQMVPTLFSVALVMLAVVVPGSFDFPILNKIFNFLGKRSYSFYVVQLLLANAVVWYTNSIYFPKESLSEYDFYRYQLLIFIVSLLIVTELVFRFIERPFRKIGQM